ncbi:hypothetical protein ACXWO6_10020, partial [Streptococcus pyogenes]
LTRNLRMKVQGFLFKVNLREKSILGLLGIRETKMNLVFFAFLENNFSFCQTDIHRLDVREMKILF